MPFAFKSSHVDAAVDQCLEDGWVVYRGEEGSLSLIALRAQRPEVLIFRIAAELSGDAMIYVETDPVVLYIAPAHLASTVVAPQDPCARRPADPPIVERRLTLAH